MRNILFTGLLMVGLQVGAQSNDAVATVPERGLEIKHENNVSYAEFELATTSGFMDYMLSEAQRYISSFVFEATTQSNGLYHCKMGFLDIQAVPQNFHKMFLALGIQHIKINGQVHSVNDLLTLK